jgi:hypothetical protein
VLFAGLTCEAVAMMAASSDGCAKNSGTANARSRRVVGRP